MEIFFKPTPHAEAMAVLQDKPAVTRDVFDRLEPELRARAFTVTGIENLDTLQRLRDQIAKLPEGAPWDEVKGGVLEEVLPYFVDPDADAETQAKQRAAAERRSELLVRHHGFQAYAVTQYRLIQETKDALPYLQYWSMGDGQVRDSHAALDGLILPANSPFWEKHMPPWEWGCRCMVTQLPAETVGEIQAEDADKAPEDRRVMEGERLARLEAGRVARGPAADLDVTAPEDRGESYRFRPQELQIPLKDVLARYDGQTLDVLTGWASKVQLGGGQSLWDWMQGKALGVRR